MVTQTLGNDVLMILSFYPGVSRGEKVEQRPSFLSVPEGDSAVIHCTYTDSASTYFFWYKHEPGAVHENEGEKQKGRLRVTFVTTTKQSALHITASQPADSATYLCALAHSSILATVSYT
uniref:Ig-like domain-containing protein n=1 Tax=Marmota marmota marmota TaxID=9994 RepID=A0A8C6ETZ9_MARMA